MDQRIIVTALACIVLISFVAAASLLSVPAPSSEHPEPETISFSYGYETRMVETHPFGEDGPIVVGCEGVYLS